ncbi:MAG: hypothetical protein RI519_07690, partial [Balneolaceae bacterium]|nr:hypothetical protein [Balneolaceae bacterium]
LCSSQPTGGTDRTACMCSASVTVRRFQEMVSHPPGPSGPNSVHGGSGPLSCVPTPRGVLTALSFATT